MKLYVLAAGYATRLFPLTHDRAKPLLEVGGHTILDHILDGALRSAAFASVTIIANHRFAGSFEAWRAGYAASVPIRVLDDGSMSDADKRGAVGDLAFALEEDPPGGDFAVVAGDNLLLLDWAPLVRAFEAASAPLLVVRDTGAIRGRSPYNEVTLDSSGRVARFREKPKRPASRRAAIALYFFPAVVAALVPRYLAGGHSPDAPGHFIAWLVDQCEVRATPLAGEWFDIGDRESLEQARAQFARRLSGRMGE